MTGKANQLSGDLACDVLVIGSGGGALTAAITARKAGMNVIVAEKQDVFGGTTATSGGMLWIPGNHHAPAIEQRLGEPDSPEKVRTYILEEAGNYAEIDRIDAFLKYGPEMIAFLERETHVKFNGMEYPDYYFKNPNAAKTRSLIAAEYDAKKLGKHFKELKRQLPQLLFLGFAIGSSVEMQQFFKAGRSPKAFVAVAGKMALHLVHTAIYGGARRVVRGGALITRLAQSCFELDIPILLNAPAKSLIKEGGVVRGAMIDGPSGSRRIMAKHAVILGSGGFPWSKERRAQSYPANVDATPHSVANPGNVGDGARMAEDVGGVFGNDVSNAGAWMPTSVQPDIEGPKGVWPHLVDRLKPGFICVTRHGKRFGNESCAYSSFVPQIIEATRGDTSGYVWLLGDKAAIDKWGMGRVRPKPSPRKHYLKNGYLIEAPTVAALAEKIGVDARALVETVDRFNSFAKQGLDPDFQRGQDDYDAYQGDDENKWPNPCLGPLEKGPYYAIKMFAGEIGTFAGINVDKFARVVDEGGKPIEGLYAVGNDQKNVFGGSYPGAGATLGPSLTFGYVAGLHASGQIEEEKQRSAA
ncbi:FAD-dependent oxidoreductase [Sphingobium sp.]|uniref:FAD-dependent oxidoreductase n=1 Tax=Sphingobium sp. TaxID=1912891 RepID=UPI002CFBDEFD|nr:FAD-dependent oxidoreductase [Sphingobium sp.]HUD91436.1 FAD-dependent oxidoreductase [Sphingobium sp.]